ncbi:hypothetical protein PGT21_009657 [Puccinia graminis f. sp. tritici]|uniref:Uncharacterized protein n=1 Tax=Puccinia graminis f. sp. tritici TaxID=56615 RepID=A0A5B0PTF8_PUCGR|nr:hypothetical protein PGT21_009657 [Puccinia graminis f. sp. tritici]
MWDTRCLTEHIIASYANSLAHPYAAWHASTRLSAYVHFGLNKWYSGSLAVTKMFDRNHRKSWWNKFKASPSHSVRQISGGGARFVSAMYYSAYIAVAIGSNLPKFLR